MSARHVATVAIALFSVIAGEASAQRIAPSALLTIDQNRATVVDRIVNQWGDRLTSSNAGITSDQLRQILAGLRADHLLAASLAGSVEGLRDVVSGALVRTDARVSPAMMHTKSLGDTADDLVYTPIVPCRILDTRNGTVPPYNAPMIGGSAFPVAANLANFASQGGGDGDCSLPPSSSPIAAIAVTLTVLNPNFDAFLAASSSSDFATLTQSVVMDFSANKGLANTAIVPVDGMSKFYLGLPMQVTTHVIADAVGYLRRPTNYVGTHVIGGLGSTDSGGINNTVSGTANTVGGGQGNLASGAASTVGGGYSNSAIGDYTTVAGGRTNIAITAYSTVGGGTQNTANSDYTTVAGGASNTASALFSAVLGGTQNTASGQYSAVAGGFRNTASGSYSFAAGNQANADQSECFVFANWSTPPASPASCQGSTNVGRFFLDHGWSVDYHVAQSNGNGDRWVRIGDLVPNQTIATWSGAYLSDVGVWTNNSDSNLKTGFAKIDVREALAQVARLPITSWRYSGEGPSKRHIGPMAQDFWMAFHLGDDDKHIGTIDESSVALAAIQGLHQQLKQKTREIARLTAKAGELDTLKRRLDAIEGKLGVK